MQNELRAIAATAALQMDGDLHRHVRSGIETKDDKAFATLRQKLMRIRIANDLTADNIYTFYPDEQAGLLRFAVMTHAQPFVGDPYEVQPHLYRVYATGEPAASRLYEDAHGQWISAAAPIWDSRGQLVGLIEVNRKAEAYFARYRYVMLLTLIIGLIGMALSSVVGWHVLRISVLKPVKAIDEGMKALGRHDFKHRVKINTRDEFQQLGETLNHLFDELNAARSVQAGFFPEQLPQLPSYRLAAASEPCDATGGDYYDAFKLDDDRVGIVVADVTGHGLGPSLIMASCRSALHALSSTGLAPGELLQRLEQLLGTDMAEGRFITMIYGVLEADGTFTYANAGHGPAMVVTSGDVVHLESHRAPLGIEVDIDGEPLQSTIHLEPGDRVLFTSDGVNEAQNPDNEHFGNGRIELIVRDRSLVCQQIVGRLREAVQTHRAHRPADDDLTILCVDRV